MEVDSQRCDHCGERVAVDEQFCPECGTFLDPMTPARAPTSRPRRPTPGGNVISVGSDGPYEEFSLGAEPPHEEPEETPEGGRTVTCPSCSAFNPSNNRHCQECGARLRQGPLPTAPRPAVPATAGVRAAFAISGLLLLVIVIAVAFNIFGNGEVAAEETADTTTTTEVILQEPDVIEILDQDCNPAGLSGFGCANLTDGTTSEFQVNWEELQQDEESLTIRLSFRQPMFVSRIDWTNISNDPDRFRQNYRARGLTINAQGSVTDVVVELEDSPGTQSVDFAAVNATWIEITVHSDYTSQVVDGEVWPEMAIEQISVIGRPAIAPTETTIDDNGDDDNG